MAADISTGVPAPATGEDTAVPFVARHLRHLVCDDVRGAVGFRGGQAAADAALAAFDVTGYAARRNQVAPASARGASQLSPYIRHGLLGLRDVWDHVAGGPARDVAKFRDELLWQEYGRHLYARLGPRTGRALRRDLTPPAPGASTETAARQSTDPWDTDLACVAMVMDELHTRGWLVNQTRMWMASHWSVRHGAPWRDGEDRFFAHLLDGSRAANRLGWQWTTGIGSSKPYGFSRSQVERRAPGLCGQCPHRDRCPIQEWPDPPAHRAVDRPAALRADPRPGFTAGPDTVETTGVADTVWLTAESLGNDDPALAAHPALPVVFVFDEPLLARLRLSSKRLVFLVETLAELGTTRDLTVAVGDPVAVLAGRRLAVTHAPVPGFRTRARRLDVVETHPWPWLVRPPSGSMASFSAWRHQIRLPS
jgi:deoxyribodipyrimidine photo-lyase